jgi:hypothetical protein
MENTLAYYEYSECLVTSGKATLDNQVIPDEAHDAGDPPERRVVRRHLHLRENPGLAAFRKTDVSHNKLDRLPSASTYSVRLEFARDAMTHLSGAP